MKSFRDKLFEYCGADVVNETEHEIRSEAMERYGSYIDFRQEDEEYSNMNQSFDFGNISSPGPLISSRVPHSPDVV